MGQPASDYPASVSDGWTFDDWAEQVVEDSDSSQASGGDSSADSRSLSHLDISEGGSDCVSINFDSRTKTVFYTSWGAYALHLRSSGVPRPAWKEDSTRAGGCQEYQSSQAEHHHIAKEKQ